MIRTQIQLTEEQVAILRTMSVESRLSIAELIRMSIDSFIKREAGISRDIKLTRAKSAAGRFASGVADVSTEHDKYLAEALGERE
jgi:hypothetical protein